MTVRHRHHTANYSGLFYFQETLARSMTILYVLYTGCGKNFVVPSTDALLISKCSQMQEASSNIQIFLFETYFQRWDKEREGFWCCFTGGDEISFCFHVFFMFSRGCFLKSFTLQKLQCYRNEKVKKTRTPELFASAFRVCVQDFGSWAVDWVFLCTDAPENFTFCCNAVDNRICLSRCISSRKYDKIPF